MQDSLLAYRPQFFQEVHAWETVGCLTVTISRKSLSSRELAYVFTFSKYRERRDRMGKCVPQHPTYRNVETSSSRPMGWRILGFGKHPEIAAAIQEKLRSLGFQAITFVLTNDEAGDARLRKRPLSGSIAFSTSSTRTRRDRRSYSCAVRRTLCRRLNEYLEKARRHE
jgi:hypothetical protein